MSSNVCTTIASPTNMASGGRLSARSSIDSWIAATCATDSRVSALENPDCSNEMLLTFSCHGRYFCPSCHAKRVAAFADWLAAQLLVDTPDRQFVFTIPKLLRRHFRFNRRLLGLLCSCAYAAIREMMQALTGDPRSVPGVVGSIHTYGDQAANWHPHSHLIVTDGVFLPDGSFHSLPSVDPQQLMLLFRHTLLQELLPLEKLHPATTRHSRSVYETKTAASRTAFCARPDLRAGLRPVYSDGVSPGGNSDRSRCNSDPDGNMKRYRPRSSRLTLWPAMA